MGSVEAPSRASPRPLVASVTAALALFASAPSLAQTSTRAATAEELFHAGRALIAQHRYKDACEKLASSQKLDPAVGTLLSLGECSMGQGKTASAWLSYRRAVTLANERRDPRSAAAEERATAVEPQLSRLVLRVAGDTRTVDVQITVNGETLEREVLREPMPIDPGDATVVVSAPGFRTWSTRVHVGAVADTVDVLVPALERLPDLGEIATQRARVESKRTIGLALGGVGLATIGVGSVLGLQAIVKIRDANHACPASATCGDAGAVQENATGRGLADAATVVIPIGAAILATGAIVYFTAGHAGGLEVDAQPTASGARVRVGWSW